MNIIIFISENLDLEIAFLPDLLGAKRYVVLEWRGAVLRLLWNR